LNLRCLFVEKDDQAFRQLEQHLKNSTDIELKLIHGEFEKNIPNVLDFACVRDNLFTFIFIDPTGWTGFGLNAISPLLQLWYSVYFISKFNGAHAVDCHFFLKKPGQSHFLWRPARRNRKIIDKSAPTGVSYIIK
jgi:three-Cys-motif partner protein